MKHLQLPLQICLLVFSFFAGVKPAHATHILGYEFSYTPTSTANVYQVTLKVYRDLSGAAQLCSNCPISLSPACAISISITGEAIPPGSNVGGTSAYAGVSYGTQSLYIVSAVSPSDPVQLCQGLRTTSTLCGIRTPGTFTPGVEIYTFSGTINLSAVPASCCLVRLSTLTCCKNGAITTIQNPLLTNTYGEIIINRCLPVANKSVVFLNDPDFILKANQENTYSPGAYDPDGDSLVFSLSSSLQANNLPVVYSPPFGATVPFPYVGYPGAGFNFDSTTGDMRFTPSGNFVSFLAYEVKEWRKVGGIPVLAGISRRDHQMYSTYTSAGNYPWLRMYNANGVPMAFQSNFNIISNKAYCFILVAADSTGATDTTNLNIALQTEIAQSGGSVTKLYNAATRAINGPRYDSVKICWNNPAWNSGNKPYYVLAKANDNTCPLPMKIQKSFKIIVDRREINGPLYKCSQSVGVLYYRGDSSNLRYQWLLNNTLLPNDTNVSINALVAGNYKLILYKNNVLLDTLGPFVLQNYSAPLNNINHADTVNFCIGRTCTLFGNYSGVSTYQWLRNNIALSGKNSYLLTSASSGTYKLIMTYNGCPDTSAGITLTAYQKPLAAVSVSKATFCVGDSSILSTATGPNYQYKWLKNDVALGHTQASYTTKTSGNFRVVVTDSTSCIDTSAVSVLTATTLKFANLTAEPGTDFCAGDSVLLRADTGSQYTYKWQINGSIQNINTAFMYSKNNTSFRVIMKDSSGCIDTSNSITTTAIINPLSVITPASANLCKGKTASFISTYSFNIKYQWYRSGVKLIADTFRQIIAREPGYYYLRVSNPNGCYDISDSSVLTLKPQPNAAVQALTAVAFCSGGNALLSAEDSSLTSYRWVNSLFQTLSTSFKYYATTAGNYRLIVTDQNTCTDTSAPQSITVYSLPTASILPGGASSFCAGDYVMLHADTFPGYHYQWKQNNVVLAADTLPALRVGTSGSYTVMIKDSNTCTATSGSRVMTQLPRPVIDTLLGARGNVYSGLNYTYSIPPSAGNIYWVLNNGTVVSGQSTHTVQVNWNASGPGGLTVWSLQGLCEDSASLTVNVINASPQIVSFNPATGTSGTQVSIYGSLFTGTDSVYFGGTPARSFQVMNDSLIQATVDFGSSGDVAVLTTFGRTSKPGFVYLSTGIQAWSAEYGIRLWPNPATDVLMLQFTLAALQEEVSIEVFDVQGRLLYTYSGPWQGKTLEIPTAAWAPGTYVLQAGKGQQRYTTRFVKR